MLHSQTIKDLHVAFITQMENFWNKVSASFWSHWHHFLQTIEPTFIKLIHFIESVLWKASREILGKTPAWYIFGIIKLLSTKCKNMNASTLDIDRCIAVLNYHVFFLG